MTADPQTQEALGPFQGMNEVTPCGGGAPYRATLLDTLTNLAFADNSPSIDMDSLLYPPDDRINLDSIAEKASGPMASAPRVIKPTGPA